MNEDDIPIGGIVVRLRPMRPDDRGYVASTWGRSYARRSGIAPSVFHHEHRHVIDRCLASGTVLMVCSPTKESATLGYACGQPCRLDYVYLAHELRGLGLARTLIARVTGTTEGVCIATHRFCGRRKASRFAFNPYLAGHY